MNLGLANVATWAEREHILLTASILVLKIAPGVSSTHILDKFLL
jgi:hypothetical protein